MSESILGLNNLPERFPRAPEDLNFEGIELRHRIVGSYRLIFTIAENMVHVLHVRHGAMLTAQNKDIAAPEESGGE